MGKADRLRQEVKTTGEGLFKGMKPLEEAKSMTESKSAVSGVIESASQKTEAVNEPEEIKLPETETEKSVAEAPEEIVHEAPENADLEELDEVEPAVSKVEVKETDVIKDDINNAEKQQKTKSSKTGSRYEKEKFLLLDIRGYRDYVEHMAKAANMSATKYIRNLIEMDKRKNNDIYEAHKALEEKLRGTWQN